MASCSTVIIPFDDCVVFVSSLNCAQFSSRLSEVAQALHAVSRRQVLVGGRGLGQRWVGVSSAYRGSLRKPGDYLLRPVAYPRSISAIAISRQLLTSPPNRFKRNPHRAKNSLHRNP